MSAADAPALPPGLDPRVTPWRPDLADASLAGRVEAARFVRARPMRCALDRTPVLGEGREGATAVSELLRGESFQVLDEAGGWAWGWCGHDGYVGHVRADALAPPGPAATHRVVARQALIFADASIKAPCLARPPMGARLAVLGEAGDMLRLEEGFVHRRHVAPLDAHEADPVAVAARLMGAPYLWGGRTGEGADCSGLVQVALGMCGIAAPRDSDQQRAALGSAVDPAGPLRRGDLVFFPGHVGLMFDEYMLLHASRTKEKVTLEPLALVEERSRALCGEGIVARRRL
ncbi:MAG: C40 family peptidase [Sphingomonadaceae bacterium]